MGKGEGRGYWLFLKEYLKQSEGGEGETPLSINKKRER